MYRLQRGRKISNMYLVAATDHLLHTKCESKESMFTGLTVLGNTSFKTTGSGINDKNSTISLGCPSDHVLNEIPVSGGIDDSAVVLCCLKFPQSNVDGNTSFTFSLELVKHPSILEWTLVHLSSFLLKPLNDTLVNTSKLVNQVTSGSWLPRVDMANDNDVNVNLFLAHFLSLKAQKDLPIQQRKQYLSGLETKIKNYMNCPHAGSNYGPSVYKTDALPLSYKGNLCMNPTTSNKNNKEYLKILN